MLFHFYLFCFLFSTPASPISSPQITGFSCICYHEWYLFSLVSGTACAVLRRIDRTCCPQGSHIQQQKQLEIRALYRKVRVRKVHFEFEHLTDCSIQVSYWVCLVLWDLSLIFLSFFYYCFYFLLLLFPKYKQVAVCEDSFVGWISDTIILLFAVTKGRKCMLRTRGTVAYYVCIT